uniref:Macoilin n=1 Tax=Anopheles maculatus TaxID=74869 RepID=A0A182SCQ7_9DIPT
NTLLYIKFLLLWASVITADFLLEFRFEFLWPFWLLLRSIYDSYKYKGLAFSVLFVCIAVTSDLVCLFFIPVQWLFFAASTYVWVQYVWHTDKGICLPTIILWILFVYLEAAIRWKDSRNIPHLNLCRPFAAHCIGYPVVTLGFGFKSYVGYRIRQRKQREVAKDNDFYMQLLQEALPKEESKALESLPDGTQGSSKHRKSLDKDSSASSNASSNSSSTFNAGNAKDSTLQQGQTARKDSDKETSNGGNLANAANFTSSSAAKHGSGQTTASIRSKSPTESAPPPYSSGGGALGNKSNVSSKQNGHVTQYHQPELVQQATVTEATTPNTESKGGSSGRSGRKNRLKKAAEQAHLSAIAKLCATLALASSVTTLTTTTTATTASGGSDKGTTVTSSSYTASGSTPSASVKDNHQQNGEQGKDLANASNGSNNCSNAMAEGKPDCGVPSVNGTLKATQSAAGSSCRASSTESAPPAATVIVQKVCESCPRLEGDLKKLRAELSTHRQTENELRQKYDSNTNNLKACLQGKQKDYDELQNRYQEHCNQRQQERQNLQTVERRLGEERRHRQSLEAQLNNERKYRKQAEEKAARAECSEACKMKKQQMEIEIDKMQNEMHNMEEAKLMAEKQARTYEQELRKMELQLRNRDAQQNTEVLMSALAAMQDKNATLEKSLSAETRFKLDLFSALGGTRREVEILTCSLRAKEEEILDLNAKIVQLLAVMPTENLCLTGHGGGSGSDGGASMMRLADAPQLLPQSMTSGHLNGIGPGSVGNGGGGGGAGGGGAGGSGMQQSSQQQPSPMSHLVQNGPSFCSQLGSLGVLTSTMTTLPSSSVLSGPNTSGTGNGTNGGQIVQMQNSNNGGGSNGGNCPSGLDPNATIYTPKNNGMVGGTEA